jgi:hypothetical protein
MLGRLIRVPLVAGALTLIARPERATDKNWRPVR